MASPGGPALWKSRVELDRAEVGLGLNTQETKSITDNMAPELKKLGGGLQVPELRGPLRSARPPGEEGPGGLSQCLSSNPPLPVQTKPSLAGA